MGLRASLGEWWEAGRKENREGREGRRRWDGTRGYQREGSDGQKRGGRRRGRGRKQTGGDEDESERRTRERGRQGERKSKGWKGRRGRDDVGAEKGGKVIKKEKMKRKMAHTDRGRSVYGLPASCAQRAEAACVERWHTTSQVLTHVVNTYERHERVTAGSAFVCKRERGGKTALVSLQLLIQNEPQRGGFIQSVLKHTGLLNITVSAKELVAKKKNKQKRIFQISPACTWAAGSIEAAGLWSSQRFLSGRCGEHTALPRVTHLHTNTLYRTHQRNKYKHDAAEHAWNTLV